MKIINIMPMAGEGARFIKQKYFIHKPFIQIHNNYMFLEASKTFFKTDKFIYIYKKPQNKKIRYLKIEDLIDKKILSKTKVIYLKKSTKGQADTCKKAFKHINQNDALFIHSCDSYFKINNKKILNLLNFNDIIVFTKRANNFNIKNYNQFGWVHSNNKNILNISCKNKASKNIKNDNVIIGSFLFKNKKILNHGLKSLVLKKQKVNNEYYLDMVVNECLKLKYSIKEYKIKKLHSFGTPSELKTNINKRK